jgi:hypothetical protein
MFTQRLTLSLDASTDIEDDIAPAAAHAGPPLWRRVVDTMIAMRMEEARRYLERHRIPDLLRPGGNIEIKRRTMS